MKIHYFPHNLRFRFPAGTSRGVLNEKLSWFILVEQGGLQGIGEAGPLPGLSPEPLEKMEIRLAAICHELATQPLPDKEEAAFALAQKVAGPQWPSIRFALETAWLDLLRGGKRILFNNAFSRGEEAISINGLIWMGDKEKMHERMQQKLSEGFSCLKMKIGAIGFEEECAILAEVRKHFSPEQITLRVDANGAFTPAEALNKLSILSEFDIHSIEQPIAAGQPEEMRRLCGQSPLAIALDEELIGVNVEQEGRKLLEQIQPQYIILKPTLLGGIAASREWISLAEEMKIGWWMTSALESNVGLNAISQFTAEFPTGGRPQGLGTGQLYFNNIASPLQIREGSLLYAKEQNWDLSLFQA